MSAIIEGLDEPNTSPQIMVMATIASGGTRHRVARGTPGVLVRSIKHNGLPAAEALLSPDGARELAAALVAEANRAEGRSER